MGVNKRLIWCYQRGVSGHLEYDDARKCFFVLFVFFPQRKKTCFFQTQPCLQWVGDFVAGTSLELNISLPLLLPTSWLLVLMLLLRVPQLYADIVAVEHFVIDGVKRGLILLLMLKIMGLFFTFPPFS